MKSEFDAANALDLCGTIPANKVLIANGYQPIKIQYNNSKLNQIIQSCGTDGFIVGNDGIGIPFDNKFSTGGYNNILFELWSKWNVNKVDEKSRILGWGYTTESTIINYIEYKENIFKGLYEYKPHINDFYLRKKLYWKSVKERTQNPEDLFSWFIMVNVDRLREDVDNILLKIGGTSNLMENDVIEDLCKEAKIKFNTTKDKTIKVNFKNYGIDYAGLLFWKNQKYISVELFFNKDYIVETFENNYFDLLEIKQS